MSTRPSRETLCRVLAEARTHAALTQRQLAARLGRAHSYVGKIETGERHVDVLEFVEIARALHVDARALIGELEACGGTSTDDNDVRTD